MVFPEWCYDPEKLSRVYLQIGMNTLVVESNRWSENALLKRTLEFKLEDEELKVDALVFEVLLYPMLRLRSPRTFVDHTSSVEHLTPVPSTSS